MNKAADTIVSLYRRHAARWAELRGDVLKEGKWIEAFIAQLPAGGSVLDIGCGHGVPIGRAILDQNLAVTGIDASPELIGMAQKTLTQGQWHVADMRGLTLGRTFDGLLAWDSFFHLTPDDQRSMFGIFRKHAHRGTALMFTSGTSEGEAIGRFEGEPLYHGSLSAPEYRALLAKSGFDVLDHVQEDPECGGHTIWLARYTGEPSP